MFEFSYRASLQISHANIDPDAISTALSIEPKRSHRVGEPRSTPNGDPLEGTYPFSYWRCDLPTEDGEDLEQFLRNLIKLLSPHREFLNRLTNDDGTIECFVGMGVPRNCDQLLPNDLLSELGHLKINLRLDIYGNELPQKGLES